MAKTENRYIRIEDWKGNVYYPMSTSSTSGVISSEAGTDPESDPYTEGQYVTDLEANNGKAIILSADQTSSKVLFRGTFMSQMFGNLVAGLRMKSNAVSDETALVEVKCSFRDYTGETPVDTLLSKSYIKASQFKTSGKYITLPRIFNYTGTANIQSALLVEVNVLPGTGATVWFDQMYIAMEVGYSRTDVSVSDRTVVFPYIGR